MIISDRLPELTLLEADRMWLSRSDVADIVVAGGANSDYVMTLIRNAVRDGDIPNIKTGSGKTCDRKYSLISAVMLRVIYEMAISKTATYEMAYAVALEVAEHAATIIIHMPQISELSVSKNNIVVAYKRNPENKECIAQTIQFNDIPDSCHNGAMGIVFCYGIIQDVIQRYADTICGNRDDILQHLLHQQRDIEKRLKDIKNKQVFTAYPESKQVTNG